MLQRPVFLQHEERVGHGQWMQRGGLSLDKRYGLWTMFWRETDEKSGRRKLRGKTIGSLKDLPTRELARQKSSAASPQCRRLAVRIHSHGHGVSLTLNASAFAK